MSSSAGVTRKGPVQSETPSDRDTLVDSQDELHMATADSNSTVVGSPEQNVRRARWDMETRGAKRKRLGEEANSAFQVSSKKPTGLKLTFRFSSSGRKPARETAKGRSG